jgi:hypothetical protein
VKRAVTAGWVGLTVAALVAVSAAATRVPVAASATRVQVTTVHGIEIVPEHTEGTFTGYSTGSLPGDWVAVVKHTPLSPNATVTGGTLTLVTSQHRKTRTLTGQFSGGTITNTNPGANCTNQTYQVVGNITQFNGNHTGRFSVTLTHYRHSILGACISYFATTTGTLTVAS